jgi:hypothetical protein
VARPSFVSALFDELETKESVEDEVEAIKNCAGLAYVGAYFVQPFVVFEILNFVFAAGAESVR